jgi:hypothetical protein
MDALQSTSLGAFVENLDLDPGQVTAIANGDPSAAPMLAEKFGIHPTIIELLIAAAMKDYDAMQEALPKIAVIPGIDIEPDLATVLSMLGWKTTEANMNTAVKAVII